MSLSHSLGGHGVRREMKKKEKKSFHFIVECGAVLLLRLVVHNFSSLLFNEKKNNADYAVCWFFLHIFIDDGRNYRKLHFKYSRAPEGSVSRRSSFASA